MSREPVRAYTVHLPESVAEAYSRQALELDDQDLEDLLSERLLECVDFTSRTPLYFDDRQREELQEVAGGDLFRGAQDAVDRLKAALSIRLLASGKEVPILLGGDMVRRLRDRSFGEPVEKIIRREVDKALRDFTNLL